jgi:hypothetical protein
VDEAGHVRLYEAVLHEPLCHFTERYEDIFPSYLLKKDDQAFTITG